MLSTDELRHYGVMGMKWGKGKKTPTQSSAPISNRRMSNKELESRIKRLRMEQDYKKLVESQTVKPNRIQQIENAAKVVKSISTMSSSAMSIYNDIEKARGRRS